MSKEGSLTAGGAATTPRTVHWACLASHFSSESLISGPPAVCEPDDNACIRRELELRVLGDDSKEGGLIEAFTNLLQKPPQETGQHWLAFWQGLKEGQLRMGIVGRAIL